MAKARNFNVKGKVASVLESHANQSLTSKELAKEIFRRFPEDCSTKQAKSKNLSDTDELIQQIAREIGARWKAILYEHPQIRATETRPRRFYYTSKTDEEEVADATPFNKQANKPQEDTDVFSEKGLYPLLGDYIYQELNCVSMRINESKSSNSRGPKGNQWLFPDTVGMINLSENWQANVIDVAESLAAERVHLCSFEVKKKINRSNVREVIFQTVSNSTWANYAYLVSAELDSKASDELRLLCLAHNIGFISLNREDPSESQILIPAKLRESINFDSLSRLAHENSDAREFLDNVNSFVRTKKLRERDWNLVPAGSSR